MVFVYFAAIRVSEVFYGFCLFYRNYGLCSLYSFFLECNFREFNFSAASKSGS